ncbi:MAG TPA: extracellular solute-binding protein [Chloroflexota bacterium]|jgi:ABC-type glycerol-3-phosphate transport system substrate-binding protein|nr:extracellular solute-binding protein [Chloroflexota bacterium]
MTGVSRRRALTAAAAGAVGGAWGTAACAGGPGQAGAPARTLAGGVQFWTNPQYPFNEDIGGEIARDFAARNPGVTVEGVPTPGSMVEKVTAAAAGGTPPDLATVDIYTPQSLAASGATRAVEDYLKGSRAVKKTDLWPTHVSDLTYKGSLVAMPMGPDLRILYISSDRYRATGLDPDKPPRTWADLEQAVARVFRASGDEVEHLGFDPVLGSGGVHRWLVPYWQLGGETLSADGEKVTIFNERGIQAMQWILKLYNLQGGDARIRRFKAAAPTEPAHFVQGRVTHYYDAYTRRAQVFQKEAPQLQFAFATYPVPPNGRRANYGGGWANVLAAGAKNPEAAWAFLEFLSEDEQNLKLVDRYDQLPIRVATAKSERFTKKDPFRILAAEEIPYRKFVIAAPGGSETVPIQAAMVNSILQGQVSVSDGLKDGQDQMQQVLDRWRR